MGRRALTAQERADRQIQRQEALRTKQTLELARECALDPNLRVVVDSTLPASYASQTTTATIGAFESTYFINSNLMASVLTISLIWLDPPYANEDDNPLNPLARETHTASTPYEPPSLPGRSNTQQDVESYDAPLIAELSALAIGGDGPAPSGVAIYNSIGFSPAEASTQPPPLTGQHDKYYHGYNNQNFQLDGNAQGSSPEAYHTMRSVTPSPSSPSLFYHDHAVFEPGSASHTPDIRGGFTSSSTSAPSPSGPGDPVLDGFLRSIYEQGTAGHVVCADCEFEMCFSHQVKWHEGLTCEQYDSLKETGDPGFQQTRGWITSNTKPCPEGSINVQKGNGCFHMTFYVIMSFVGSALLAGEILDQDLGLTTARLIMMDAISKAAINNPRR
ncbi:hypothetical protein FOYG_17082 [Fusarium oxysporum NRRL 32931]|uniref:IBR domain-containing protein n=1 Tax=Fusarium oxysporum NRRL 32931 TaxID=660029 RepID=W9HC32_FUSOX|nr:hypothetical protein FOYG_17082 [Fusarium oxysporum NRRL 32931]